MNILWQSKSPLVYQCFNLGKSDASLNGGNAYDLQAMLTLKKHFDISADRGSVREQGEPMSKYVYKLRSLRSDADLLIMEPFPVVFGRRKSSQRTIAMIHHIDPKIRAKSLFHQWYFSRLIRRLRQCDRVVTVSVYWKKFLERQGCENVDVIYNSFDPSAFRSIPKQNQEFRKKHGIPETGKVVYIGNAIKEKGVYDVYEGLKNSGYYLVMTGAENRATDLPVHYLKLDRNDYLQLLALSSVVIAMSKMEEGWNRIAHEAMLCKTPVIGSGAGGMAELLEQGGQVKLNDLSQLAQAVEQVITQEQQLGVRGYEYVKQFDLHYFEHRWVEVVNSVMGK